MTDAPSSPQGHDDGVLAQFIEEIKREFPRFRIVEKTKSRLNRVIDVCLKFITFYGQSGYMTEYHTVLGYTLYVPGDWEQISDIDRVITLRHERVHLRQRRRYTMLGMALLYLLPFFPLGLAYGRARIEWEAYCETLRAVREFRGPQALRSPALRSRIVKQFTSPAYGWMWPFRKTVERWYDQAVQRLTKDDED